jgi:hypothetical protein
LRHPTPPAWHYLVLCLVHPILKYLPDSVVSAGIPVYHSLHLTSASAVDLFRQGHPVVKNKARIQA